MWIPSVNISCTDILAFISSLVTRVVSTLEGQGPFPFYWWGAVILPKDSWWRSCCYLSSDSFSCLPEKTGEASWGPMLLFILLSAGDTLCTWEILTHTLGPQTGRLLQNQFWQTECPWKRTLIWRVPARCRAAQVTKTLQQQIKVTVRVLTLPLMCDLKKCTLPFLSFGFLTCKIVVPTTYGALWGSSEVMCIVRTVTGMSVLQEQ